jgi:hypothetical protein
MFKLQQSIAGTSLSHVCYNIFIDKRLCYLTPSSSFPCATQFPVLAEETVAARAGSTEEDDQAISGKVIE